MAKSSISLIFLKNKVYYAKTEQQQEEHGHQLQNALAGFLDEFLHHMEEEEKVGTWFSRVPLDTSDNNFTFLNRSSRHC